MLATTMITRTGEFDPCHLETGRSILTSITDTRTVRTMEEEETTVAETKMILAR
jgi:hypothetical protein